MKCPYCEVENPDPEGKGFCSGCGMKLVPPKKEEKPVPKVEEKPKKTEEEIRCPNCGVMNPVGSINCKKCGQSLKKMEEKPSTPGKCPKCGAKNPPDATFCMKCAIRLAPEAKPPEVAPKPPVTPKPKAKLILPNKVEIQITEKEHIFGREDFTSLTPDVLKYISRKSKQQFKITEENNNFYIQDDSSANGTILKGEEIKGKGRKELKDGDEIVIAAGEVKLAFRIPS